MNIPWNQFAESVALYAKRFAKERRLPYVDSGHVLAALLTYPGDSRKLLEKAGLHMDLVDQFLEQAAKSCQNRCYNLDEDLPWTLDAVRITARAQLVVESLRRYGHTKVSAIHLLLAICHLVVNDEEVFKNSPVTQLMSKGRINPKSIGREILSAHSASSLATPFGFSEVL